jgi:hypothetical protein
MRGDQLLQTIQKLGDNASKREICLATGYFSEDKGGKTKLLYSSMLSEMLLAKGVNLPESRGSGGPSPSFSTSTLSNGQVVIGKCYVRQLGAKHGDSWDIDVDEDARTITISLRD